MLPCYFLLLVTLQVHLHTFEKYVDFFLGNRQKVDMEVSQQLHHILRGRDWRATGPLTIRDIVVFFILTHEARTTEAIATLECMGYTLEQLGEGICGALNEMNEDGF